MRRKRRTDQNTLAQSIPIRVREDCQGKPEALGLLDGWTNVMSVESVCDEWGTVLAAECVVKSHYQLLVSDGSRVRVFKNQVTGGWYKKL